MNPLMAPRNHWLSRHRASAIRSDRITHINTCSQGTIAVGSSKRCPCIQTYDSVRCGALPGLLLQTLVLQFLHNRDTRTTHGQLYEAGPSHVSSSTWVHTQRQAATALIITLTLFKLAFHLLKSITCFVIKFDGTRAFFFKQAKTETEPHLIECTASTCNCITVIN